MQKPRLRKPRFIRSDGFPPLHLTERDVSILRLVERHRFVSSRHVTQMIGGSAQHVTRRLGRLFHVGFLHRPRGQLWLPRGGNAHLVCCITFSGQAILRERGLPTYASPPRSRGETMALSLSHFLCVTDVMLALERSAVAEGSCFLHHDEWRTEDEARLFQMRWGANLTYDGKRVRTAVLPDGAFAIEKSGKRSYFFVEVDRGTMPVSRGGSEQTSFRRKVLAYKATRDTGILWKRHEVSGFRVLVITEHSRRLRSLQATTADCFQRGESSMFCFAQTQAMLQAPLSSWQTCSGKDAVLVDSSPTIQPYRLQIQEQQRSDS
ncbi:MAG: replication-relaxation family protein [Verrucomicrobiaceae bacterium]|nr:replication-relaxation family protein [Verrucomicrobiaceae bacterium]